MGGKIRVLGFVSLNPQLRNAICYARLVELLVLCKTNTYRFIKGTLNPKPERFWNILFGGGFLSELSGAQSSFSRLGVQGLGFRVWGFRIEGLGFRD